jgi:hypothetical protein
MGRHCAFFIKIKAKPHGLCYDKKFQNLRSAVFFVRIRQMRGVLAASFRRFNSKKRSSQPSCVILSHCSPLSHWQLYLRVSAHILYIPASATIYCGREEVISHALRAPPLPSRMMKFYEVAAVK